MVTFTYELGKTNAKGYTPIYIRVCVDRQYKRIRFFSDAASSDITKKGEIKNASLELAVTDKIQEYRRKLLGAGADSQTWDIEKVYNYITEDESKTKEKEEFKLDFIEFGNKHIERLKKEGREKTAEGYRCAIKSFCKFLGNNHVDINRIDKSMLLRYKEWFEENNIGARAFELYMSNLQALHNKAKLYYNDEDDEHLNIRLSPFQKIDFKISAAEKRKKEIVTLAPSAIKYMYDLPTSVLSQRAQMARDAFLLSFGLCGMNAIDMMKHTTEEDCPEDLIEFYRSKTVSRAGRDSFIRMHIHQKLMEVHRRLRGKRHTWYFAETYSSTNNFNTALNKGLAEIVDVSVSYYGKQFGMDAVKDRKKILKMMGMPEHFTFYAARDSFSTIAANDCHIPTETIDRCLCHVVKSVAAQFYIKKDYQFADDTIKAVVEVVFGK